MTQLGMVFAIGINVLWIAVVAISIILCKRCKKSLYLEIDDLKKKILILNTSNDFLRSTNADYKNTIIQVQVKRANLKKELDQTKEKLEETQKKLSSFSKMLKDMKNS